jgi:hypothetical protein
LFYFFASISNLQIYEKIILSKSTLNMCSTPVNNYWEDELCIDSDQSNSFVYIIQNNRRHNKIAKVLKKPRKVDGKKLGLQNCQEWSMVNFSKEWNEVHNWGVPHMLSQNQYV